MPFPALFGNELKTLDNKNAAKNCFIVELLVMEKLTLFNQDIYDLIYFQGGL
jgi:hypothetical protein